MAKRVVVMVLCAYWPIAATNSVIQLILCQLGVGLTSNGASGVSIHFMPLIKVEKALGEERVGCGDAGHAANDNEVFHNPEQLDVVIVMRLWLGVNEARVERKQTKARSCKTGYGRHKRCRPDPRAASTWHAHDWRCWLRPRCESRGATSWRP